MKRMILMLAFILSVQYGGLTQEVNKDKLRQVAQLPRMSISPQINFTFSPLEGVRWDQPNTPTENDINELRQSMKGDVPDAQAYYQLGQLYAAMKNRQEDATQAFKKSAELFQQQVEKKPDDASLLIQLGAALNSADSLEAAEKVLRKAVQLAPREWRAWAALGNFLAARALPPELLAQAQAAGKQPVLTPEQIKLVQSRIAESYQCFDKAVELAPTEPQPILLRGSARLWQRLVLNALKLEDAQQNPFADSRADLEEAARLSNTKESEVNVRELLGMIQFVSGTPISAERNLRRVLVLAPERERAWHLLVGVLMSGERYQEIVPLTQNHLQRKDSLFDRMLLAKVSEKMEKPSDVEEQVRAALRVAPEDFTANLSLAVLLLKRGDEVSLKRAGELLDKLGQRQEVNEPTAQADYRVTHAIYLALTSDANAARVQLQQVLANDENHKGAKAALTAWQN